jgi:hypothetical protein
MIIKPKRMRWAGHRARMNEMRNSHEILLGKSEGRKPLGRSRHRWEDNIKIYLGEIRLEGVD